MTSTRSMRSRRRCGRCRSRWRSRSPARSAHFLTLANIAEQHHRVRRRRDYLRDPARAPQPGSFADTFARLLRAGVSPDALHAAVASMRIELVLTAHPTAITRRTLAAKHVRIAQALERQDRPGSDGARARRDHGRSAPRDPRDVGHRRRPAAPSDADGRSAQRPVHLRADAVGRAAALPARARPRAARRHRTRTAARRGADRLSGPGLAAIATATRRSRRRDAAGVRRPRGTGARAVSPGDRRAVFANCR